MSETLDSFEYLTIRYPEREDREAHEELLPVRIEGDRYILAEHSTFIPMIAGDTVAAEGGLLTDVVEIQPRWVIDVFFNLKYPNSIAEERVAEWMADGYCNAKLTTNMTARLSTENRHWLLGLKTDEAVHWVDVMRAPDTPLERVRAALRDQVS